MNLTLKMIYRYKKNKSLLVERLILINFRKIK